MGETKDRQVPLVGVACGSDLRTPTDFGTWIVRHAGPVGWYHVGEGQRATLCEWHANMHGDTIKPVRPPRVLTEVERGHVVALTKVVEVVDGWVASVRDNADVMGRSPDDAESGLSIEDFRVMLVDAARELGVLDEYRAASR